MNSEQNPEDSKRWYKQFWPWFLIAIPGAAIIACIWLIVFSFSLKDDLVAKHAYREGLDINRQMDAIAVAYNLGLKANIDIKNRGRKSRIQLVLMASDPSIFSSIAYNDLSFHNHHSRKETYDDKTVLIQIEQRGNQLIYEGKAKKLQQGKYYLSIAPVLPDVANTWLIKETIVIQNES